MRRVVRPLLVSVIATVLIATVLIAAQPPAALALAGGR